MPKALLKQLLVELRRLKEVERRYIVDEAAPIDDMEDRSLSYDLNASPYQQVQGFVGQPIAEYFYERDVIQGDLSEGARPVQEYNYNVRSSEDYLSAVNAEDDLYKKKKK